MTVACRVENCPLNDKEFCCDETILIGVDGRCHNLVKGFTPDEVNKLRKNSKMDIEDVIIDKSTEKTENNI